MNNMAYLEYFIEYFDLKDFIANNHPLKLLAILGAMIAMMIAAYFLCELIRKKIIRYVLGRNRQPASEQQKEKAIQQRMDENLFSGVMKNARLLLYLLILGWGMHQVVIGPVYLTAINLIFTTLCTLAAIRFVTAFIPFQMDVYFRRRGATLKDSQARSLLPIIWGLIWAVGGTFLLDNIGLHVSTIVAGLGIMGVAVGLAGQAILKDFFSYIVILLDKPFKVGDFVELSSGKSGSVDYVGPKTTRLLSLEGNTVVCANSEMTSGILVNQGSIREREVELELGIAYSNPMPVVRKLPEMIREVVNSFPQCRFERCCMLKFGSANYLFQLIYRVSPQPGGLNAFMNTQTDVNLAIQDMLNRKNIPGAYPTQTILLTDMTQSRPAQTQPSDDDAATQKQGSQPGRDAG